MEEMLGWHEMGPVGFVLANPDLADSLGRMDLNFDILIVLSFWTLHFWISRSPDLQISGFPGPQISKFPDFQVSKRRRLRTNSQIPT